MSDDPTPPGIAPPGLLRAMFDAAVARSSASRCLPPYLPPRPEGRTVVVGAGKAAAAMAQVLERDWDGPLSGLVITRYGHAVPCRRIEVREAAHPVPDEAGVAAAAALLAHLVGLTDRDLVICVLSGGGSALLAAPPPSVPLADVQAVTRALLRSGADIAAMNCVRRHLSMLAGGRLALAAAPATLFTLAISDVPGDDRAALASGPTVADPTSSAEALAVLARLDIAVPHAVRAWLADPRSETPKPGSFAEGAYHIVAGPQAALEAAAAVAASAGYRAEIIGSDLEGEARTVAADHAKRVRYLIDRDHDPRPVALLSGGETTITVRGGGRGGRNAEFLLALAIELDGVEGVHALAADTDGIDGSEDNAGAVIGPDTLARARRLGIDPAASLADNDAYGLFAAVGALVMTGPTLTNVNDFRAILLGNPPDGATP